MSIQRTLFRDNKLTNCSTCGLQPCKDRGGYVPNVIIPGLPYLVLGEAPGEDETIEKQNFVGKAGKFLWRCFQTIGLTRPKFNVINTVSCRPPKNRPPKMSEIKCCNARVMDEIKRARPQVIFCLGGIAMKALGKKVGINDYRGTLEWSEEFQCFIKYANHPSRVIRVEGIFPDFIRDLKKGYDAIKLPKRPLPVPKIKYSVVRTLEDAKHYIERLSEKKRVSCDIETTSLDPVRCNLLCVGVGLNKVRTVIFPRKIIKNKEVRVLLRNFLRGKTRAIYQNAKFDVFVLRRYLKRVFQIQEDTMLLHYCLDERKGTHKLKLLAREFCGAPSYDLEIKQVYHNKFAEIPKKKLFLYNANDCSYTLQLHPMFWNEVKQNEKLLRIYKKLIRASNVFHEIEYQGVSINLPYLAQLKKEIMPELKEEKQELHRIAKEVGFTPKKDKLFNPNSSQQLSEIIYDCLSMPLFQGKRTSKFEALEKYRNRHPFFKVLLKYRELSDGYKKYIQGIEKRMDDNGRLHTSYMLAGTETGRFSSHNPNLQNIKRGGRYRKLFCASEGHVFVHMDYEQLEVRVACLLSGDKNLLKLLDSKRDLHTEFASISYSKPADKITKEERSVAKSITFGILYGRGAYSLATESLHCSEHEAQRFMDAFLSAFPELRRWRTETQKQAIAKGFLVTPYGRVRRFPYICKDNVKRIERQAVNFPIQSTGFDIVFSGLLKLDDFLKEQKHGRIILSVHDEINFEIEKEHYKKLIPPMVNIAETIDIDAKGIAFPVGVSVGPNWGELEDYKH